MEKLFTFLQENQVVSSFAPTKTKSSVEFSCKIEMLETFSLRMYSVFFLYWEHVAGFFIIYDSVMRKWRWSVNMYLRLLYTHLLMFTENKKSATKWLT